MKKICFLCFLGLSFLCIPVFAYVPLNMQQFLSHYFSVLLHDVQVPDTYKDIQVKYSNISSTSSLYPQMQKAIYLGLFPNAKISLPLDKPITQQQAILLMRYAYPSMTTGNNDLLQFEWLRDILLVIQNGQIEKKSLQDSSASSPDITEDALFQDVYAKIQEGYLGTGRLDAKALLHGTIKGLVDALNDPYTSFFPPVEAKSFNDEFQGEFYGIGAYVEMTKPGIMIITSPIPGSPAAKIGLQAQDRIIKIDDHVVEKDTSLVTATSWIKGPEGTKVHLQLLRDGSLLELDVVRAKITIQNIESERVPLGKSSYACVVRIHMFDLGVSRSFLSILSGFSSQSCTKYIFDLRNNPGGSLEEVLSMLNPFVPVNQPLVQTRSRTYTEETLASQDSLKLTGAVIRILVNGSSASASEIFAGVVREYVPNALLVGTKTFGKGSVQSLVEYMDGSMLKYTVAKRYTGKNKVNIDHEGFQPDVKIDDNTGTKIDEVFEWAVKH